MCCVSDGVEAVDDRTCMFYLFGCERNLLYLDLNLFY